MKDRLKVLITTLFALYLSMAAEREPPPTRRPTREEIQERERQAALRDLERLKYQGEHPTMIPDLPDFIGRNIGRGCKNLLPPWRFR
jgi:hypothetical protein